jgi:uncharacterized FlgJ-related protein
MKLYFIAATVALVLFGGTFLLYQNQVIKRKDAEIALVLNRAIQCEKAVIVREKEVKRLNDLFVDYLDRDVEIETKYINRTKYVDRIKEVPAEIVVSEANRESNEILADIRGRSTEWLRNQD